MACKFAVALTCWCYPTKAGELGFTGGIGVRSICISIGGSIQCYIGCLVQYASMMCRAKSCALTSHELVADAVVELLVRAHREE